MEKTLYDPPIVVDRKFIWVLSPIPLPIRENFYYWYVIVDPSIVENLRNCTFQSPLAIIIKKIYNAYRNKLMETKFPGTNITQSSYVLISKNVFSFNFV